MVDIIEKDGSIKQYDENDIYALNALRHTCSHIMAQAVKRIYKNTKLATGPYVENGFYYDIDFLDDTISDEDFEKIEKEMNKIVKEELPIERYTMSREEAIKFFKEKNEDYKVEIIENLPQGEMVYFAKQGEFVDLCSGTHVSNTKFAKDGFKIMSVAGAYLRGDEKNKMLTRIYGTAFFKNEDLSEYINMIEEAKKRDHRKLGKELKLFLLDDAGPGLPFFLPNGMILRNELTNYWVKYHLSKGYKQVNTPIILSRTLWEKSGHWEHYKDGMMTLKIDDVDFAIKPMNCPGAIIVYKNESHSYRELPLRYAELGLVHRNEKSGELHGLMRVRGFTQDDAHTFLMREQVEEEVMNIIELYDHMYSLFKFDYTVELSTMPDDHMGTLEEWQMAEQGLKNALEKKKIKYIVNPGDGAFYGPKIDFHLKDCIGRTWQCGTIQLDFQLPQRFDLEYVDKNGEKAMPIMIHRACFGSVERFIGILIEHFKGAFPLWISPKQVIVIPISDKTLDYANQINDVLLKNGIRTSVDDRAEKMGYKIREAQMEKIPYMIIVGPKEREEGKISIRERNSAENMTTTVDEFLEKIKKEIEDKICNEQN